MKTLNLVYPEKSDIKWKLSKFPDGQQNVTIETKEYLLNKYTGCYEDIKITSRLNNWLDLELIICAVKSLQSLGHKMIHLYTPYIIGARSDRKFSEGGNNYLKDVICPILNSLELESITCIDPHSHVLEACLKRFRKESNIKLIELALNDGILGQGKVKKEGGINWINENILVSPDAGASHKIYKLAEQIGYKGDVITCSKERDENGKLTKTVVPTTYNQLANKDIIILDDICDGGNTFINIAKEISKFMDDDAKLYLIVTHGIFSKGFNELADYFDKIYCTNSYQDLNPNDLSNLGNMYLGDFVKQLNVF